MKHLYENTLPLNVISLDMHNHPINNDLTSNEELIMPQCHFTICISCMSEMILISQLKSVRLC